MMTATDLHILENRNTEMPIQISMLSRNAVHAHGIRGMLDGLTFNFSWHCSVEGLLADECPEMDLFIFECGDEMLEEDFQLFEDARARYQGIQILAILPRPSQWMIKNLGANQINGMLLLENMTAERLKEAVRQLAGSAKYYVDEDINAFNAQSFYQAQRMEVPLKTNTLTRIQKQILELSARGYSSEEIGEILNTTRSNITQHRTNIISILNVKNMVMAIVKCLGTRQLSLGNIMDSGEYDFRGNPLRQINQPNQSRTA